MGERAIIVVPHDPGWPAHYAAERSRLQTLLSHCICAIHHIGSTSIPGLAAKPVIDMIVEVRRLDDIDVNAAQLVELGYAARGEYGIPGRRFFTKGESLRTHHLHDYAQGDPHIDRHLAFRDFLRAHADVAEAYGRLKMNVAASCNNDIGLYCAGKEEFVNRTERAAIAWRASTR